jgi:hypothetical protein
LASILKILTAESQRAQREDIVESLTAQSGEEVYNCLPTRKLRDSPDRLLNPQTIFLCVLCAFAVNFLGWKQGGVIYACHF